MSFLNKLFCRTTHRLRVSFHMKSGKTIEVLCDKMEVERTSDGKLNGYNITGRKMGSASFISLLDIEAITYIKL